MIIPYVFINLKLHNIVIDINRHISCLLKNANIAFNKQKNKYPSNILYTFFLFVSIVAKVIKSE